MFLLFTFILFSRLFKPSFNSYVPPATNENDETVVYYSRENFRGCQIESASLFEVQQCSCTLGENGTVSNPVLSNKLTTKIEHLLVRLLSDEHVEEEVHFLTQLGSFHTYEQQCKLSQYFNLYGDLVITFKTNVNSSVYGNDCNSAKKTESLYLPDVINRTYIKKQLLYWKTTDIKTFIVLCSLECTAMLLETSVQVEVHGDEYTWITHYREVMSLGIALPQNLLIVTDEEDFNVGRKNQNKAICYHLHSNYNKNMTKKNIQILTEETGSKIYAKTDNSKLTTIAGFDDNVISFNSRAEAVLETFPHKHDLPTRNVKVVTVIDGPYTMIHEHSDHVLNVHDMTCSTGKLCWKYEYHNNTKIRSPYCCYGYCMDLISYLAEDLQLIPDIYIVEDSAYGQIVNGTWVGMVGDVVAGKADLIFASLSINSKRAEYIDFSFPFMTGGIVLLVMEERNQLSFFNFESLSPLSISLWLTILLIAFLASFLLVAMEAKCFIKDGNFQPRKDAPYPWSESFAYLGGLLFQKDIAGKNPQYMSTRVISIFIAILMLVIMSTYTAVLTAAKVTHKTKLPVTGMTDQKITNPTHEFKFGTLANSTFTQMFAESKDPVWNRIGAFMNNYNYVDSDIAFGKLKSGELDAILAGVYAALHHMSKDCRLQFAGDIIPESGYGVGLKKGSSLKSEISKRIIQYGDNGKLLKLHEKWIDKGCTEVQHDRTTELVVQFEINYFGGMFIVMILWIVLSMLVLAVENFVDKWQRYGAEAIKARNAETPIFYIGTNNNNISS